MGTTARSAGTTFFAAVALALLALGASAESAGFVDESAPDAFGYVLRTSVQPGGPAFAWVDVRGDGTPLALAAGEVSDPVPLGFAFPFYADTFREARVSSDGRLVLLDGDVPGAAASRPTPVAPAGSIAALWTALDPAAGEVHVATLGDEGARVFVVQFTAVPHADGTHPVTFQARLHEGGVIEVLHAHAPTNGAARTVGIASPDGLAAHTYLHGSFGRAAFAMRWELGEVPPPAPWVELDPPTPDGLDGWWISPVVARFGAVGLLVDGGLEVSLDGGATWARDAETVLDDGTHELLVRATDRTGNVALLEDPVVVRVDTTAPTVRVETSATSSRTVLRFVFGEPMDVASTEAALYGAEGWTLDWDRARTVLTLERRRAPAGEHAFLLTGTASDAHGVPLAEAVEAQVEVPEPAARRWPTAAPSPTTVRAPREAAPAPPPAAPAASNPGPSSPPPAEPAARTAPPAPPPADPAPAEALVPATADAAPAPQGASEPAGGRSPWPAILFSVAGVAGAAGWASWLAHRRRRAREWWR